jgi:RHS repeat-associated protein
MDRGGQTYYYHQNTLWSVEAVTDSAANVVERYTYDAYGCVTVTDGAGMPVPPNPWSWGLPHSAIGNPYMFTGRQLDEETGLYYYRARYYDCVKGRFLQRDPIGYKAGINLYEYVNGKTTNRMDPMGLRNVPNCCCPGGRWDYQGSNLSLSFGFILGYMGGTVKIACTTNKNLPIRRTESPKAEFLGGSSIGATIL